MNNIKKTDFQKLSLNFRRISSNLLNSNYNNFHRILKKFLNFIDENPIIKDYITDNINEKYDFSTMKEKEDALIFELPISDSEEISYIYQLLIYISNNNFSPISLSFRYGSRDANNKLTSFNHQVIKPLIDNITTYLTELKIDLGYQENYGITNQFNFEQDFSGQINQATSNSTVTAYQNYNKSDIKDLKELSTIFLNGRL